MEARKSQVLIAVVLGLVALLALVGALGAAGEGLDALAAGGAVAEGLVGHWQFDEGSGTTAYDASGLDNHGTLTPTLGPPVYTTTAPLLSVPNPYALDFDGDDDYVIVDSVADEVAGGGGAWSASLWVKAPTLASGQDGLLAVNTAKGGNVVILFLRSHNFSVYDDGTRDYEYSRTEIDDDRWHHLAYTSDGDQGTLYVDGRAEATHTVNYVFDASNRWSLGQEYDGVTIRSDFFTGLMDEVRVYTRTLSALEVADLAGIIFVDADAAGAGTGFSWTDAFTEVQTALSVAQTRAEIWVAEGVYYPDYDPDLDAHTGWVTATFPLTDGVGLYGGFDPGGGVTVWDQRNPAAYVTVLSGDLDRDDTADDHGVVTDTANIAGANAWTVVTGSGVDGSAVLDGFTVTAGNANGTVADCASHEPCQSGGGMYNHESGPTLTEVTFSGNSAGSRGGGMCNYDESNPSLVNATFSGNSARWGGGMFNDSSSPTLEDVTFRGNSAAWVGGGMANHYSSPTLVNVTFSGNSAQDESGGMDNEYSSPTLVDAIFSGNSAGLNGGGMCNYDLSSPSLVNVTSSGNSAGQDGGGMFNSGSSPTMTNCILWGNTAGTTGDQIYNSGTGTPSVSYSDIQGGWEGEGNINADPLFVVDPDPGGDGIWGTPDDNCGDLRLRPGSPAIDAGDNAAVPAWVTTDLAGWRRFIDIPSVLDTGSGTAPIVDMGAYETPLAVYLPLVLRAAP